MRGHDLAAAPVQLRDTRVIEIADEPIGEALVGEDAILRFRVFVHRVIAVEVVGCDVQQYGDTWFERANRFELERRYLGDDPVALGCAKHFLDQRVTDIAADAHAETAFAQQVADECGRRRLALRTGHGDDRRATEAVGEFDLADHRDVGRVDRPDDRGGRRNTRR